MRRAASPAVRPDCGAEGREVRPRPPLGGKPRPSQQGTRGQAPRPGEAAFRPQGLQSREGAENPRWQPATARSSTASGSTDVTPPPSATLCDRCRDTLGEDLLIPHAGEMYTELLCRRCWQRTVRAQPRPAVPTAVSKACLLDHQLLFIHAEDMGTCDRCRTQHFHGSTVFECDTCPVRRTYCHDCKREADLL